MWAISQVFRSSKADSIPEQKLGKDKNMPLNCPVYLALLRAFKGLLKDFKGIFEDFLPKFYPEIKRKLPGKQVKKV